LDGEQKNKLGKTISGRLELKYKGDNWNGEVNFAFINDYYVSKAMFQEFNIIENCNAIAQVVYTGDGDK
jgi:restriction endonuclease S subunit